MNDTTSRHGMSVTGFNSANSIFTTKKSGLFCIGALWLSTLCANALAAPQAPQNLSGQVADGEVALQWAADSSDESDGYNIYANGSYIDTVFTTSYSGSIDPDSLVSYTIVAFGGNPVEFSPASAAVELPEGLIPTDLSIPPSQPGNLTASVDGSELTLSWEASTDDEAVQGYNVYQNDQYLTTVLQPEYQGSIDASATFNWYVVAFDIRQNFSEQSTRLRYPDTGPVDTTIPPSTPTDLTGQTNTGTNDQLNTTVSWQASTDDQQVAGYNVYLNGQYQTTVFDTAYETTINSSGFTDFSVVAFDFDGNFSSTSATLTLPELTDPGALTEPPTQPQNLQGTIDGSDLTLNWTDSTDNIGVGGYNLYQNNDYLTTVFDNAYAGRVTAGQTYSYYVVAFDRNGNFSPPSDDLLLPEGSTTPSAEPPTTPENLAGTIEETPDGFEVNLSWSPSQDDGSIAGYNVYINNGYLTTTAATSLTIPVPDNGPFRFHVVAFDVPRNFSDASARLSLPDDVNQPPFFVGFEDQTIEAGQNWSLVVRPQDNDGGATGLLGGRLPEGMRSDDNFDGTRTLYWQPLQPALGDHQITFTAIDGADSSVTVTETITLSVVLPEDLSTIPNPGPTIDAIGSFNIRPGDTLVMRVKAVDANGTIPQLEILNPPTDSTFDVFPLDDRVRVLRWTPDESNLGERTFSFRATDADDPALQFESSVTLGIVDPSRYIRPGERLRELAEARDFLFGYAHLLEWYEQPDADLYADTAAAEFNMLSTENSMKMGYINPERGVYRWEGGDREIEFARENNMVVHGHPLIWYTVLPPWILQSEVGERESIMNTFIDDVVSRYADDVAIWDVVNEALEEDGSFRNSVWFEAMGEDYIDQAFFRARENDADATLLYNDFNVAYAGPKSDGMYTLLSRMLADGVPVDGVGFQMHLASSFDRFDEVAANFQRFADLGLDVYITELDVVMEPGGTEDEQAAVFADAVAICLAQPACKAAQIWGFTDRYTWLNGRDPLVLDRDYQPKPAYGALQNVLQ